MQSDCRIWYVVFVLVPDRTYIVPHRSAGPSGGSAPIKPAAGLPGRPEPAGQHGRWRVTEFGRLFSSQGFSRYPWLPQFRHGIILVQRAVIIEHMFVVLARTSVIQSRTFVAGIPASTVLVELTDRQTLSTQLNGNPATSKTFLSWWSAITEIRTERPGNTFISSPSIP